MEALFQYVDQYPILIALIGSFFAGSVFITTLSILAAKVGEPLYLILPFCIIGNYVSDVSWYGIGRLIEKKDWKGFVSRHQWIKEKIKFLKKSKRDAAFFISIKFVYGSRILTLLSLGVSHYPFFRFLRYDLLAVIIINSFICYAGWAYGHGTKKYLDTFSKTGEIISIIFFGLIFLVIMKKLIQKFFFEKS